MYPMLIENGYFNNMEVSTDMNKPLISKMDPRYIAACIGELPTLADPQEVEIIKVMEREVLSTSFARTMVEKARQAVRENWRDLYARRNDTPYVYAKNQEGTAEFAEITNAEIVSGQEHLQGLEKGKPVLFSANHLGFFKLIGFNPEKLIELGFDGKHALDDIYYSGIPFYGPLYPVAEQLNDSIHMAAEEEPGILGEFSRATGYIDVPPASMLPGFEKGHTGRVEILTESTRDLFERHQNSAVVVFPEGGTTGKRNGGNTRELGKFHAGIFVIASKLEVPVVLLAHRFNPNKGFEISIAGVVRLGKNSTKEEIQKEADIARGLTQTAFDKLHTG